jgi:hypothetical protein
MTATTEIAELGSFARLPVPPLRGNQAGETTLHRLTADLNLAQPFDRFSANVERRIRSQVHRRLGFVRKLGSFRKKTRRSVCNRFRDRSSLPAPLTTPFHGFGFVRQNSDDGSGIGFVRQNSDGGFELGSFGRNPSEVSAVGSFDGNPSNVPELGSFGRIRWSVPEMDFGCFAIAAVVTVCSGRSCSTHLAVCIAVDERALNARTLLNAIVTSTTLISSIWLGLGVLIVSGWNGRYYSESRRYLNYRQVVLSIAQTNWAT